MHKNLRNVTLDEYQEHNNLPVTLVETMNKLLSKAITQRVYMVPGHNKQHIGIQHKSKMCEQIISMV